MITIPLGPLLPPLLRPTAFHLPVHRRGGSPPSHCHLAELEAGHLHCESLWARHLPEPLCLWGSQARAEALPFQDCPSDRSQRGRVEGHRRWRADKHVAISSRSGEKPRFAAAANRLGINTLTIINCKPPIGDSPPSREVNPWLS